MTESKHGILLTLIGAAAFVVLIWGIGSAADFFIPLCLAALLSFGMAPVVRILKRYNTPEWASVLVAAFLVLLPIGLIIYFAVAEIRHAVVEWPKISASLKEAANQFKNSEFAHNWNLTSFFEADALSEKLGEMASSGAIVFLGGMLTALSAGTTLLLIIFFAVMMLASRDHLRTSADFAFDTYGQQRSAGLLDEITKLIEAFLIARFGITAVSSAACWVTLMAFGIPYSFLLALFYGLMTWVPVIGVVVALAPIIAVAIAVGKNTGVILISNLLLIAIWMVQDHILQPKWLGGRLKLNFFATYFALFVGEHLWGAWGMFLSVPLLGVLRIIFSASDNLKPIAFLMSEEKNPADLDKA